jgi:hypothetical protein
VTGEGTHNPFDFDDILGDREQEEANAGGNYAAASGMLGGVGAVERQASFGLGMSGMGRRVPSFLRNLSPLGDEAAGLAWGDENNAPAAAAVSATATANAYVESESSAAPTTASKDNSEAIVSVAPPPPLSVRLRLSLGTANRPPAHEEIQVDTGTTINQMPRAYYCSAAGIPCFMGD